jgi:hypothetical protein
MELASYQHDSSDRDTKRCEHQLVWARTTLCWQLENYKIPI